MFTMQPFSVTQLLIGCMGNHTSYLFTAFSHYWLLIQVYDLSSNHRIYYLTLYLFILQPQNALVFQALRSKELDNFQFKMSIPRIWIHNMELQGLTAGGVLVCRDSGRGSLSITKLTFGIFR